MAKVRVALTAENFGAGHAMAVVRKFFDGVVIERLKITGPATAGIKLVIGVKQRRVTTNAVVLTLIPVVPVGASE